MLPAFRRRRDYDEAAFDTYVDRDGRLGPLSYAIRDHACSIGVDPLNFAAVAPVAQLDRALRFERSGRRFESVRAHQFHRVCSGHIGNDLFRRRNAPRQVAGRLRRAAERWKPRIRLFEARR
jgi:hypothetical protein